MSSDTYIPVGRTSLANKGHVPLQVQTEYASRPYPRVTTTVLREGRLLQKIERKLEYAVDSIQAQQQVEAGIQQQHTEVVSLIEQLGALDSTAPSADPSVAVPASTEASSDPETPATLHDRLEALPGFLHMYRLDQLGAFVSAITAQMFKKDFPSVTKNLESVLDIFPATRDNPHLRQVGVCEIERERLYLVSMGNETFFVSVHSEGEPVDYEKILKELMVDDD